MKSRILFVFAFCAALLVGFGLGHRAAPTTARARQPLYYVDPMHPSYRSDKPGIAPDCGMKLEPVYSEESQPASREAPAGSVSITPEGQRLIGVQTERVQKNSGAWLLRTTGHVEADTSRVYRLMAATEGFVQSAESRPPGTVVKKDEQLSTFYSEELRNAQQAYLGSISSIERVKGPHDADDSSRLSDTSLHLNEQRLRSLGMGEAQMKELQKARRTTRDITLVAPADGVILANNVTPAQRFDRGEELYRIADLSTVWILADVQPNEAKALHPGARVKVSVPELDRTIYATVTAAPPAFDSASRTLKVRLQASNPGMLLRPDMFVDLEFSAPLPPGLFIPQEAVLNKGTQKIVYVEKQDDLFEPRQVETGSAYGDRVAVLNGLQEGEIVVAEGQFLIDSETRMRSAGPVLVNAKATPVADHDPVCGMELDPAHPTGHTATYKGESFSFCSETCKRKFQANPAAFTGKKVSRAAMSGSWIHD